MAGQNAMTDTNTTTKRDALLAAVSRQLTDLARSVAGDVSQHRDDASGRPGGGFIAYSLNDTGGEPLKDIATADAGVEMEDLKATLGFTVLKERCDALMLHLRLDLHFYASGPRETRIYRVVIDGWP